MILLVKTNNGFNYFKTKTDNSVNLNEPLLKENVQDATEFINNRATVKINDKWYLIDENGTTISKPYLSISPFSNNAAIVKTSNSYSNVINRDGIEILPRNLQGQLAFNDDGFIIYRTSNRRYNVIDTINCAKVFQTDMVYVDNDFLKINDDIFIKAYNENSYNLYILNGQPLFHNKYQSIYVMKQPFFLVTTQDNSKFLIDVNENVYHSSSVIKPMGDFILVAQNDYVKMLYNVNNVLEPLLPTPCAATNVINKNFAAVREDRLMPTKIVDLNTKSFLPWTTDYVYESTICQSYKHTVAFKLNDKNYVYSNLTNTLINNEDYNIHITPYTFIDDKVGLSDVFKVKDKNNNFNLINAKGQLLLPFFTQKIKKCDFNKNTCMVFDENLNHFKTVHFINEWKF